MESKYTVYDNKEDCCGCTACQHVCPTLAIKMQPDVEGFLYPEIDHQLCIECGKCREVCAFRNGYDTSNNFDEIKVLAAKHTDSAIRLKSSSGGVFTALSDYILDNNGVVFGAQFDEKMNVFHGLADTTEKRNLLRGSKYVQSDLGNTFATIKSLLNTNKLVLFTGTPCQNSGLKSFLSNENCENLIQCDIVCHGTPSPLIWREHIACLEKKAGSKIVDYKFRPKSWGWRNHIEQAFFENGETDYKSLASQSYKKLFYGHVMLRPSCHCCIYTNFRRPSDITIADFWGIERSYPQFVDTLGVSLVLINTEKGLRCLNEMIDNLKTVQSNAIDCMQPQLRQPAEQSPLRERFWRTYLSEGYEYACVKFAGTGFQGALKNAIRTILSKLGLLEITKKLYR